MKSLTTRFSAGVVMFAVVFSVVACLTLEYRACAGHAHSGVAEHLSHMQFLTLAVIPVSTTLALAVVVYAFVILYTPVALPKRRVPIARTQSPPPRTKLARLLSQLRSPPAF